VQKISHRALNFAAIQSKKSAYQKVGAPSWPVFGSAGGAIVNLRRDASGRRERSLELAHLPNRDQGILGACHNEHIALD
jgi:hypothetical protein